MDAVAGGVYVSGANLNTAFGDLSGGTYDTVFGGTSGLITRSTLTRFSSFSKNGFSR